ncbi:hypothetical protein GCM10014713_51910 [Streptomyces purpureus]|uniref:Thiamine-binding protein domain-containing protein n=2 Tax=Streptomyces purpureus TaxID=1951 RepID=A0A918HB79_9ACTN|nr:hypothetical protein GCM10014713_51910 [Streptomyces purpureus]
MNTVAGSVPPPVAAAPASDVRPAATRRPFSAASTPGVRSGGSSVRYGESPETLDPGTAGTVSRAAEADAPGACDALSAAIAAAAATVPRTALPLCAAFMAYAPPCRHVRPSWSPPLRAGSPRPSHAGAAIAYRGGMQRLRVEFTTEPFDLDEAPAHAVVAREVIQGADLDAVDVGPFGNTAEGGAEAVLTAVDALLRQALGAGATRVSLQVNVIGEDQK